jgi:exopolysaccharide production protein ExoZ
MYHGLQFLRFLCAFSVVLLHASEAVRLRTGMESHMGGVASRLGIETFFVISGFLMVMVTPAAAESMRDRAKIAKQFFLRRLIRVAPMYWLYSAAKVAMVLLLPALTLRSSIDWAHVSLSFLFIPTMAPWGLIQPILPVGWTLNFEFLFYVIFAASIVITNNRAVLASTILFGLFLIGSAHTASDSIWHFYGRSLLLDFALGMGVAHLTKKQIGLPTWFSWSVLALAAIACATHGFVPPPLVDKFGFGALSTLILWGTISLERSFLYKLKNVSLLGDASYSIYLSHSFFTPGAVVLIAEFDYFGPTATAIGATVIPCALGCVAYKLVEQPLTTYLRNRFDRRPHAAST